MTMGSGRGRGRCCMTSRTARPGPRRNARIHSVALPLRSVRAAELTAQPLRVELLEEAGLEQLLAVHREERIDRVADDADDLALAPGGVADQVALLERPEHRPLDPLDLERAAAAGAAVAPQRLLEQRLAGRRVTVAPRRERRSDVLELARG